MRFLQKINCKINWLSCCIPMPVSIFFLTTRQLYVNFCRSYLYPWAFKLLCCSFVSSRQIMLYRISCHFWEIYSQSVCFVGIRIWWSMCWSSSCQISLYSFLDSFWSSGNSMAMFSLLTHSELRFNSQPVQYNQLVQWQKAGFWLALWFCHSSAGLYSYFELISTRHTYVVVLPNLFLH